MEEVASGFERNKKKSMNRLIRNVWQLLAIVIKSFDWNWLVKSRQQRPPVAADFSAFSVSEVFE